MALINIKNVNTVIFINRFILFSNESIMPSLNISGGKIAKRPIMMMIITTQKELIISFLKVITVKP